MSPPDRHRDTPWPIRRAPAIAVSSITLAAGVALLLVSAAINHAHAWAAGLLVNIGTTVLLVVPLIVLAQLFEWRLVRAQQRTSAQVQTLSAELDNVRKEVSDVLQQLNADTVRHLAEQRVPARTYIDSIKSDPSRTGIACALRAAESMHLFTMRGPRVAVPGTPIFARWENVGVDQSPGQDDVMVTLERDDGSEVAQCIWPREQSALDFSVRLGNLLRDTGHYPGDAAYRPGLMFDELYRIFDLGYRHATRDQGITSTLGPIVQLVGKQWVITDQDIVTSDNWGQYSIPLSRLDDLDWDEHMRGKPWVRIEEFRLALDTAKALLAAGAVQSPAAG